MEFLWSSWAGGLVRILLVEDELFVRIDVPKALRRAGFQVIEAADADATMEFINSGERIDLVFTDVWTPGVSTASLWPSESMKGCFIVIKDTQAWMNFDSETAKDAMFSLVKNLLSRLNTPS